MLAESILSKSLSLTVTAMQEPHWDAVHSIYQEGIDTGHATFASAPPNNWAAWTTDHLNEFSLVAVQDKTVVGWAALSKVSGRCVYAGVAEVSVYVSSSHKGHGAGRKLLSALIERSEAAGLWTLQAGIFPENAASIALHRQNGFEPVGLRRKLGKMNFGPLAGQWRDVLLLERRSQIIGVDV